MNDYTSILADTVERLFQDLMANGMPDISDSTSFDALWATVEDLGIPNLLLTEDRGGFEADWSDAFPLFKLLGRHGIPLPIGETIIARRLLQDHGMSIPDSAITIGSITNCSLNKDAKSGQWLFTGSVTSLPWGQMARSALIHCRCDQNAYWVLLQTAQAASVDRALNLAEEPRDSLQFVNSPVLDLKAIDNEFNELFSLGTLLRSCQMAGALNSMLELCSHYVQERKQFGRPLSKFQAIQHQLALLAEYCAVANCAAQSACQTYSYPGNNFETAAAKLSANRIVGEATSIAHQVHGAIGFTREYRLHYYTQRLWAWRSEFGNDRHWANYLGQLILQDDLSTPWEYLTARSTS